MVSDFPSDVRAVSNAIVAGAFSDLCAVYASGQVAYDNFARLCAERAASLLGVGRWVVAPMTRDEELALLLRAVEAGAFDDCFETYLRIGPPAWRLRTDSNATALAIVKSLTGRESDASTVASFLGQRASNVFWDAAYRARHRR